MFLNMGPCFASGPVRRNYETVPLRKRYRNIISAVVSPTLPGH